MPRVRSISLGELGAALGREVEGDARFAVRGVAPLAAAGPEDLSFARSPGYARALAASRAGAVIVPPDLDAGGRPALRSPRPDLDFARAVALLVPAARPAPGVHPSAVVAADARIDPSASVGPLAVVGARATVGPRSVVHPHVVLYPDVRVGADCVLHAGCVLREEVEIGDRVVLHPGAVLGGDGFGYALDEGGRPTKVPQVGRVVLEDDVEVGANATIDRATLGETRVRRNAKIDNLVVVSHNCDVGEDVLVAAQSGLAGSTTVGRGAILMGQTASAGHLTIGAASFLGARAALHKDLPPGSRVWGAPALEERRWHKSVAAFARLPDALRRLRAVERKLGLRRGDGEEPA
ncbi:MAG TPA: UDP-3-O-(3-hydroxymyristoyl)glucosamine N-acyltransferase [Myxococcota bacterium]|nr:UDP-3-O-(3-hydroxymyristoyl)glucosamine N-acyltransferase [Myxococcota bacterium]